MIPRSTLPGTPGRRALAHAEAAPPVEGDAACASGPRPWTEIVLEDGAALFVPGAATTAVERWPDLLAAAAALRDAGIVAPEPAPEDASAGRATERALRRPRLAALAERWPGLTARERGRALRAAGALVGRIHAVRVHGYGPAFRRGRPLQWFLAHELGVRGFPAVAQRCPEAVGLVEGLLESIPGVITRVEASARLTHNGLCLGNLLCRPGASGLDLVGVGDPGDPAGGPPEADLAQLQLAHGPLSGWPLGDEEFAALLDGYGAPLDATVLAFYRAFHVVRRLIGGAGNGSAGAALPPGWLRAATADMEAVHAAG